MISIIIPTLNEESVIEERLRLMKRLTLPHEIIVSDGRSNDRTVEIARGLADKVIEYTGEARQTIAMGRNAGAAAATGEFMAFFDADCSVSDPDAFFREALRQFDDRRLTGLVGDIRVLPQFATISDKVIYTVYNRYLWMLNNVLGLGVSGGEFQMMRKTDFNKIGGYDEKLVASEDMDLLSRLAKLGKVKLDLSLVVFHTGRRAHKIGWPKLLFLWTSNSISMMLRKKAYSKEWEPIR